MKIANAFTKAEKQMIQHIDYLFDKLPDYLDDENTNTIIQLIYAQQKIISHLIKKSNPSKEVPERPAGIWAVSLEFEQWFVSTPMEIIQDMKQGEIVIVRKSSHEHYDEDFPLKWMTAKHMKYEHDDKEIYVATTDSPTCTNWFQKYDGTIGNKIKIINNFMKGE